MLNGSHDVIRVMNDLIETCRDSEQGFHHAARSQSVRDGEVRSLFATYARQANQLSTELEAEVRRLGGNPDERDMFDGLARPGWIIFTRKLTGEDEIAILAECECGVHALEKSYAAVLEKELPDEVRSLLGRQHLQVKDVHGRIHALAGHRPFGARLRPRDGDALLPGGRGRLDEPMAK
jgi:uncharacterized protein (TIGR02284 family)